MCINILPICSLELWNAEVFASFSSLFASLLDHQQRWTKSAKVILTKKHCIHICQIWRHLFGKIDMYSKLCASIKPGENSLLFLKSSKYMFEKSCNVRMIT